jgi:hypothetical protein
MEITDPVAIAIIGAKPVAAITDATIRCAEAFLSTICKPAAKELGQLFKDNVHAWRAENRVIALQKAEQKMIENGAAVGAHAHPRIVHEILEECSWTDDVLVQELWSGLLSSSCTETGDDDSNLLFTDLLASLTKLQARILKYGCENAAKYISTAGLVAARALHLTREKLHEVTGEQDIHRLDRELDRMRSLALISNGLHPLTKEAEIGPTALALHMYVRCQGSRLSTVEYFKLEHLVTPPPTEVPNPS